MSIHRNDRGIETEPDSEDPGLTDAEIRFENNESGGIRTPDLSVRSRVFYPD